MTQLKRWPSRGGRSLGLRRAGHNGHKFSYPENGNQFCRLKPDSSCEAELHTFPIPAREMPGVFEVLHDLTEREKMFKNIMRTLVVVVVLAITAGSSSAQGLFGNQNVPIGSSAASYYYLGGKEGLTISVNLWGFVKNPGRYEVPSSTDLVQLISFGGGPLEHAQLDGVKIVRQIMQPDSSYNTEVIPVDLKNFQQTGQKTPLLLPGDTIIVPGSTFSAVQQIVALFRDVALIFSGVGTLILVLRR